MCGGSDMGEEERGLRKEDDTNILMECNLQLRCMQLRGRLLVHGTEKVGQWQRDTTNGGKLSRLLWEKYRPMRI